MLSPPEEPPEAASAKRESVIVWFAISAAVLELQVALPDNKLQLTAWAVMDLKLQCVLRVNSVLLSYCIIQQNVCRRGYRPR